MNPLNKPINLKIKARRLTSPAIAFTSFLPALWVFLETGHYSTATVVFLLTFFMLEFMDHLILLTSVTGKRYALMDIKIDTHQQAMYKLIMKEKHDREATTNED